MKTCKHCGEKIGRYDTECRVNHGFKGKAFVLCESCRDELANNGKIIQCEACGEYFSSDVLVDEEIHGNSFTECPNCHRDVVDQLTREEFIDEHRPIRFAVVVYFFQWAAWICCVGACW